MMHTTYHISYIDVLQPSIFGIAIHNTKVIFDEQNICYTMLARERKK